MKKLSNRGAFVAAKTPNAPDTHELEKRKLMGAHEQDIAEEIRKNFKDDLLPDPLDARAIDDGTQYTPAMELEEGRAGHLDHHDKQPKKRN